MARLRRVMKISHIGFNRDTGGSFEWLLFEHHCEVMINRPPTLSPEDLHGSHYAALSSDYWRGGGKRIAPSLVAPQIELMSTNAISVSNSTQRSPVRITNCVAPVYALLGRGRPFAVIWGIVPVCILAINGKTDGVPARNRPVAKRWETAFPLLANSDSSSTVEIPAGVPGVRASGLHATPNIVETCSRGAMRGFAICLQFSLKAAARFRLAIAKGEALNQSMRSAFANALPDCVAGSIVFASAYDSPSMAFLTGHFYQGFCVSHGAVY